MLGLRSGRTGYSSDDLQLHFWLRYDIASFLLFPWRLISVGWKFKIIYASLLYSDYYLKVHWMVRLTLQTREFKKVLTEWTGRGSFISEGTQLTSDWCKCMYSSWLHGDCNITRYSGHCYCSSWEIRQFNICVDIRCKG